LQNTLEKVVKKVFISDISFIELIGGGEHEKNNFIITDYFSFLL
jgi:hypothetical protein